MDAHIWLTLTNSLDRFADGHALAAYVRELTNGAISGAGICGRCGRRADPGDLWCAKCRGELDHVATWRKSLPWEINPV